VLNACSLVVQTYLAPCMCSGATTWPPTSASPDTERLQAGSDPGSGYVSDQQTAAQMSVLNTAFSSVLIFVLAGVQRIANHPEWW